MTNSKLQNAGRLYYVEPNDTYNNLPNGIPHPYEDYCISVDFTVMFGDRNSCGPAGYENNGVRGDRDLHFSSDNGTINFVGGTNGFLTTNFTDIESTNPQNNTNECLGIESIDISYTSWYIPEVRIRFVDVRGASLMAPQEQAYVDHLKDVISGKQDNGTAIDGGSFFKALFSFPYPMFKLKVKGFYGRDVTYNLSVETFQANFNAETGNFEIDAKFIGYMFGVYTDVPMNLVMIAPFVEGYGKNYWDTQKFRYLDDTSEIVTYPRLRQMAAEVFSTSEMETEESRRTHERIAALKEEIRGLKALNTYMRGFLDETFPYGWCFIKDFYPNDENSRNFHPAGRGELGYGYYLCGLLNNTTLRVQDGANTQTRWERFISRLTTREEGREPKYTYYGLCEEINKYNTSFVAEQEQYFTLPDKFGMEFAGNIPTGITLGHQMDKNGAISDLQNAINRRLSRNSNTAETISVVGHPGEDLATYIFNEWVLDNSLSEGTYQLFVPRVRELTNPTDGGYGRGTPPLPDWVCEIEDKITEKEREVEKLKDLERKAMRVIVSKNLGFNPTIGNAFRMAFAHLDTFMEIFNSYLREIKYMVGAGRRSLKTLGVNRANTDLPLSYKETTNVPPFTMFYEENNGESQGGTKSGQGGGGKKKVPIWPGKLQGDTSGLVEIDFVNKLIEAARGYGQEWAKEFETTDESNGEPTKLSFLPLTNYDIVLGGTNPYTYLADTKQPHEQFDTMLLTLLLRAYNWYSTSGKEYERTLTVDGASTTVSNDYCGAAGRIEAKNLFHAHPTILSAIRAGFAIYKDSYDKFEKHIIRYFTQKTDGKVFDIDRQYRGENVSSDGVFTSDFTYQWLSVDDKKVFPISNGNPTIVDVKNKTNVVTIGGNGEIENVFIKTTEIKDRQNTTAFLKENRDLASNAGLSRTDIDTYNLVLNNIAIANSYVFNLSADTISKKGLQCTNNVQTNIVTSSVDTGDGRIVNTYAYYTPVKSNSNNYYFEAPSYINIVKDTEETYHELYGHPLFYKQNDIKDNDGGKRRTLAKAFLFCMGLPIRLVENKNENTFCRAMALWEGALWYEYEYRHKDDTEGKRQLIALPNTDYRKAEGEEVYLVGLDMEDFTKSKQHRQYQVFSVIHGATTKQYSKVTDFKSLRTDAERACLAKYFEDWALTEFKANNLTFELDLTAQIGRIHEDNKKTPYYAMKSIVTQVNGFKTYEYVKFKQLFCQGGSHTSTKFYDIDAKIKKTRGGESLHLEAVHTSDVQQELINNLFREQCMLIHTDGIAEKMPKEKLREFLKGFYNEIIKLYKDQIEAEDERPVFTREEIDDEINNDDIKLSTYLTLKNLYDRWICMTKSKNRWKLGARKEDTKQLEESEFNHFRFIDSFYHDIEDRININLENLVETASQMMASANIENNAADTRYVAHSFYDFLTTICQKNEMILMALPMENSFTTPEGIAELFDVQPYSKMDNRDTSCYVCLYANRASQHLDVDWGDPEYMYASDGFNIANASGKVMESKELIPQIADSMDKYKGYHIPAFGVTYAKQNQSIFKRINVNMQNPQVTEAVIAATQLIASKASQSINQTALYGQDLYKIYANYSYTCVVEMMGNAQIMPLTYFQLNNIPLFRGTYLIIKIEHHIKAGDMSTVFTGVRMSKYDMPYVSDEELLMNAERDLIAEDDDDTIERDNIQEAIQEQQEEERTVVETVPQQQEQAPPPQEPVRTTPTITLPAMTFPYTAYTHSDNMDAYNRSKQNLPDYETRYKINNDPDKLYDASWTSKTESGEIITGDTTANTRVMYERKETIECLNSLANRIADIQSAWRDFCARFADRTHVRDSNNRITELRENGFDWTRFTEIKITSGFRSITKNEAEGVSVNSLAGGITRSQHGYGTAVDMQITNPNTGEIANRIDSPAEWTFFWFIVLYHERNNLRWGRIINEAVNTNWIHYAYTERFENVNKISIVLVNNEQPNYKLKINTQRKPQEEITLNLTVGSSAMTVVLPTGSTETMVDTSIPLRRSAPEYSCTGISPREDGLYVYGTPTDGAKYMQYNAVVRPSSAYANNCDVKVHHYEKNSLKKKYRGAGYPDVADTGRDTYLSFLSEEERWPNRPRRTDTNTNTRNNGQRR